MFKFLLVDGTNRAHAMARADFAHVSTRLADSIRAAARMFGDPLVIVCWDHDQSCDYKRSLMPQYKGNREHLGDIRELVRTAQPHVEAQFLSWTDPGYEADELLMTLGAHLGEDPFAVYSNDGDMTGLLEGPGMRVQLATSAGDPEPKIVTAGLAEKRYGIKLSQWDEYRALIGDSGDNLPGVAGIGPKTAVDILTQYPDVASAVRAGDALRISKARREKLAAAFESGDFELSKVMTKMRSDAKIPDRILEQIERVRRGQPPTPIDVKIPPPPF